MKLHLNTDAGQLLFTGYGDDHVLINGQRHESSLLLTGARHRDRALGRPRLRRPDRPRISSGSRDGKWTSCCSAPAPGLRFPHPSLTRALVEARIGLEVMDIGALCRTYNILAAEGRKVGAAVLITPPGN